VSRILLKSILPTFKDDSFSGVLLVFLSSFIASSSAFFSKFILMISRLSIGVSSLNIISKFLFISLASSTLETAFKTSVFVV
jgi:hypothetical protein